MTDPVPARAVPVGPDGAHDQTATEFDRWMARTDLPYWERWLRHQAACGSTVYDEAMAEVDRLRADLGYAKELGRQAIAAEARAVNDAEAELDQARAELAKPRCTFLTCGGDDVAGFDELRRDRDAARAELSAVRARLDRHRAALADALEGMEEMRPDVPEYFREKYGCDDYIARAKAVLAEQAEGQG